MIGCCFHKLVRDPVWPPLELHIDAASIILLGLCVERANAYVFSFRVFALMSAMSAAPAQDYKMIL